jgi:hypothetical protein
LHLEICEAPCYSAGKSQEQQAANQSAANMWTRKAAHQHFIIASSGYGIICKPIE